MNNKRVCFFDYMNVPSLIIEKRMKTIVSLFCVMLLCFVCSAQISVNTKTGDLGYYDEVVTQKKPTELLELSRQYFKAIFPKNNAWESRNGYGLECSVEFEGTSIYDRSVFAKIEILIVGGLAAISISDLKSGGQRLADSFASFGDRGKLTQQQIVGFCNAYRAFVTNSADLPIQLHLDATVGDRWKTMTKIVFNAILNDDKRYKWYRQAQFPFYVSGNIRNRDKIIYSESFDGNRFHVTDGDKSSSVLVDSISKFSPSFYFNFLPHREKFGIEVSLLSVLRNEDGFFYRLSILYPSGYKETWFIDIFSNMLRMIVSNSGSVVKVESYKTKDGITYASRYVKTGKEFSTIYEIVNITFEFGQLPMSDLERYQNLIDRVSDNNTPIKTPQGAEQQPKSPIQYSKKIALLIGNSAYQFGGSLKNPVNDVRALSKALASLGFQVIVKENLTKKDFQAAVRDFGSRLTNFEVGLFYYAGHGIQHAGTNYLIPVDSKVNSEAEVDNECINANIVLRYMEFSESKVNILILDACRNNPFERSWRRGVETSGLAHMSAPTGTIVAYATAPGKTADDGTGSNGLYTSSLLKQLEIPGLTIEQVFKRVRADLNAKTQGGQIPWESTSLTGDFYFRVSSN